MPGSSRNTGTFDLAARRLEDAFFLEQDRILVERLREMKRMAETKESLAAVSGITSDAVLARLVELDVKPEIVAALATVPLIEVAWADGAITPEEREVVLAHANGKGIRPGSVEHELLERWLTQRPEPKLLEAWREYLKGLCAALGPEERTQLREELLHATKTTAAASGGFLGIGRISRAEQEMLDTLAASFCR